MAEAKDSEHFQSLRARAIESYSPEFHSPTDVPLDAHYPIDEPATALRDVFERESTRALVKTALIHFKKAEVALYDLAKEALAKEEAQLKLKE